MALSTPSCTGRMHRPGAVGSERPYDCGHDSCNSGIGGQSSPNPLRTACRCLYGRLKPVSGGSFCEWKGMASYVEIQGTPAMRPRVAWTYRDPTPAFIVTANYLAFYPHAMDACYVGEEKVQPQVGDIYCGWITANIRGPCKGAAGTAD